MPDKTFDILIDIRTQLQGLQDATKELANARKEAEAFNSAFKIGGAVEAMHLLTEGGHLVARTLEEWVKDSIEFNAELQRVKTSIAGIFLQQDPKQFRTFDAAKQAASDTVDLLKVKANELGVAYTDMFETYQHAQALLTAGGVRNVQQQIDVIALLNRAMQSLGVNSAQASRDISDLLQGGGKAAQTIGVPRLAALVHMTTQEFLSWIESSKEAGTLAQDLQAKFAGLAASMGQGGQTFDAHINRMHNAILDLKGAAGEPIIEPLIDAIRTFTALLKDEDVRAWGATAGAVLHDVYDLIVISTTGWKLMAGAVKSTGDEIRNILAPLLALGNAIEGNPILKAFFTSAKAAVSVVAPDMFAPSLRGALGVAGYLSETFQTEKAITAEKEKQKKSVDLTLEKLGLSKAALEFISKTESDIALKRATAAGDTEAIAQIHAKEAYEAKLKAAKEIHLPQAQAVALAEQERDATLAIWRAREGHKSTQEEINALTHRESELLRDIKAQQQLVTNNPFLFADDKQAQLHARLIEEQQAINDLIALYDRYIEAHRKSADPAEQEKLKELSARLHQLGADYGELTFKIQKTGFTGELQAELVNWVNSFGTAAHQVAGLITGTLNTAIGGLSQGITGLITGTQTWQQAWNNAVTSVIGGIVQVVVQFIAGQIAMFVIRQVFGKQEQGIANKAAAQSAAAWAPAATSASIASYGAAAGFGVAAYIAALAVGEAAAIGVSGGAGAAGFKKGGYTGDGDPNEVAGPAHRREFVFSETATTTLGLARLNRIHAAASTGVIPHFQGGGGADEGYGRRSGWWNSPSIEITGGGDPWQGQQPDWTGGGSPSVEVIPGAYVPGVGYVYTGGGGASTTGAGGNTSGNRPYWPPTFTTISHSPGYIGYGTSQMSASDAMIAWSQSYGGTPNLRQSDIPSSFGSGVWHLNDQGGYDRVGERTGAVNTAANANYQAALRAVPMGSDGFSVGYVQRINNWISGLGTHHAAGGRIAGVPSPTDNILAWLATGEHVISTPAVAWAERTFGSGFLDSLNAMRIQVPARHFAMGGLATDSAARGSNSGSALQPQVHIGIFDNPKKLGEWMEGTEGSQIIVDVISRRAHEVGIGPVNR